MEINFNEIESHEPSDREKWMDQARTRLSKQRLQRAKETAKHHRAYSWARDALQEISVAGGDPGSITVRPVLLRNGQVTQEAERAFGYKADGTKVVDPRLSPSRSTENARLLARVVETRNRLSPPMARMVHRSHLCAATYLTALFVANCLMEKGETWSNKLDNTHSNSQLPTWSELLALERDEPARRRLVKALNRLNGLELVTPRSATESRGRWSRWLLLAESADSKPYTLPSSGVQVPIAFFLEGWHLALTPPELACYLMFQCASSTGAYWHRDGGIGISRRARILQFGITDEAYTCANELVEYGLLSRRPDTVDQRRGGKVPIGPDGKPSVLLDVYRYDVLPIPGDRAADDEIASKLASSRIPRMEEYDTLATLYQHLTDRTDRS